LKVERIDSTCYGSILLDAENILTVSVLQEKKVNKRAGGLSNLFGQTFS